MTPQQPDHERIERVERVVRAYEAFMHALMSQHAPEVTSIDITMAQAKALYAVLATGELRMSDLAARLGVTSSTATGQVDRLVELGLLGRRDEPGDRRGVIVAATAQAAATMEHLRELNSRRMRELLSQVPPDDLVVVEQAIAILNRSFVGGAAASAPTHPTQPDKGTDA